MLDDRVHMPSRPRDRCRTGPAHAGACDGPGARKRDGRCRRYVALPHGRTGPPVGRSGIDVGRDVTGTGPIDGITFDSRREADRYLVLKSMEEDGAIEDLRRQVRYELIPAFDVDGKHYRPVYYVADFVYRENDHEVIEGSFLPTAK